MWRLLCVAWKGRLHLHSFGSSLRNYLFTFLQYGSKAIVPEGNAAVIAEELVQGLRKSSDCSGPKTEM